MSENTWSKVWECRSTNGRWGMALVAAAPIEGRRSIFPGRAVPLGEVAGTATFRLDPGEPGEWVVCGGDLVPVEGSGAVLIKSISLQSYQTGTIINARAGAILRWTGYKGRAAGFQAVGGDGRLVDVPASVLLALGLIQPDEPPAEVEPAREPDTAMATALRAAGVIQ